MSINMCIVLSILKPASEKLDCISNLWDLGHGLIGWIGWFGWQINNKKY
jgi:hypothetical protein